jgi:hypothetical protein
LCSLCLGTILWSALRIRGSIAIRLGEIREGGWQYTFVCPRGERFFLVVKFDDIAYPKPQGETFNANVRVWNGKVRDLEFRATGGQETHWVNLKEQGYCLKWTCPPYYPAGGELLHLGHTNTVKVTLSKLPGGGASLWLAWHANAFELRQSEMDGAINRAQTK